MSSSIEHVGEPRGSVAAECTTQCEVHFKKGPCGRKMMRKGATPPAPAVQPGRIPRVSRLMALAIHFDGLIRRSVVRDYADIARLGLVTRARVTQIMNLLLLAPVIQEEILSLPRTAQGKDTITERQLRAMTAVVDWSEQRRMWREFRVTITS